MHHLCCRSADAGLGIALRAVKRTPLWPAIDFVLVDDESAVVTDGLAVFLVRKNGAVTFRALAF